MSTLLQNFQQTSKNQVEHIYNMNHSRRGKAIIFNHTKFEDSSLSEREGTKVDKTRLSGTLKEVLKFDIQYFFLKAKIEFPDFLRGVWFTF